MKNGLYIDLRGHFWVIVKVHPDGDLVLCVPMLDRPDFERRFPDVWEMDKRECFPLVGLEGYGEPILNYGQARWLVFNKNWKLCQTLDNEMVGQTYRQWQKEVGVR